MKRKSKCIIKSIITFVLTVTMVLGALPFVPGSMVVHAGGGDGTSPETAIELDGTGAEETAWKNMRAVFNNASSIKRSDESADNPTYYKLTIDFTANQNELGEQIVVGSDRFVVLDLNGHTLNRNCNDSMRSRGSQGMVIIVNGELTLTDSVGEGKITGGYDLCNFDGNAGAGVLIDSGKFTMNGGTICGNTAAYGGGVYVDSECEFTMNGGTIMGNSANTNGGGVYVDGNGMFNMNGGTIVGNTAKCGGGVYIGASGGAGRFVTSGGTITGNNCSSSYQNGGGVFLQNTCICEISGSPVIRDNYKIGALSDGVYVKGTGGIDNNLYRLKSGSSDKVTTITGILQEGAEIHGNINYDSTTCNPIAQYDESYVPSTEVMKADVNRFYCDNESTFVGGLYDNKIYFRKPLTDSDVTISEESFTYNGEVQTPTITVKDGDEIISTDTSSDRYYVLTYDTEDNSNVTFKDAGDYTVIISGPRYYYVKENALTIEPKPVTITGLGVSGKVYDGSTEASVTGTATIDGKVGNDDVSVSDGSANFSDVNAGTDKVVIFYGYSLTGDDAGNYTLSAQPANVTANITLKDVTVTADDKTMAYGEDEPELTATVTGLVGNDTIDYSLSREAGTEAGTYTITPTGDVTQGNYTVTYETGTFTINADALLAQVFGHNLTLNGRIGVNTYMILDSAITGNPSNYQVEFWNGGVRVAAKKVSEITSTVKESGGQNYTVYGFTYTTVAKEADTIFTMKIKDISAGTYIDFANSDGTTISGSTGLDYSISTYLEDRITNSQNAEMVALAKNMKAYCAYARHYFDVRDNGSTESLPSIDGFSTITADTLSGFAYDVPENIDHFTYKGTTLVLEDQTSFRMYFESDDTDALSISVGGSQLSIRSGKGMYYVEISNIEATDLDNMYDFTISNGSDQTTAHHGPMGYAYWALSSSDNENLKYTMMALYQYNRSAENYFNN